MRVDVPALPGPGVQLRRPCDVGIGIGGAARRQAFARGCPGSLQGAVERRDAQPQHLRRVRSGEAEDVAQHQRRPLSPRQVLQQRDERQVHRLARLVAGLGPGVVRGRSRRVGLEPRNLFQRRAGREVDRELSSSTALDQGQATVGGDAVEPGTHVAARRQPVERRPCPDQRLLDGILGILDRPEHPVAVHLQLGPVTRHSGIEVGTLHSEETTTREAPNGASAARTRPVATSHPRRPPGSHRRSGGRTGGAVTHLHRGRGSTQSSVAG